MANLPKSHRALVATGNQDRSTEVRDKTLPKLDDGDVLVNVKAVTLNPTDWKHAAKMLKEGDSTGSDFAGVVAAGAGDFKEGDRVAGFTRGGYLANDNGAFQEYIKSPPALIWRMPAKTSFEEAASMGGIGSATAVYVLCYKLGLPRWSSPSPEPIPFLIWSGATSVCHYAVQLAKILNLKAYVTASPKHHAALKALGAHECFDYKDEDVAKKIKTASGGAIRYGIDGISEHGTTKQASEAFSDEGGKLATLLPVDGAKEGINPKVEIVHCLIYAALKAKNAGDHEIIASWNKDLPRLLEQGKFQANPIKLMSGGLENIPEGLSYLQSGKVSGEKLAYKL